MILTLAQIRSVTFGAVRILETPDGLLFRRCTELQEAGWKAMSDKFHDRCTATSGVRLDFHTDADYIAFQIGSESKMEVLVDGMTAFHLPKTAFTPPSVRCEVPLPTGEHRVTLLFPNYGTGGVLLQEVSLSDGASLRPHTYDKKMLFFGDSITQGQGTTFDSNAFPARLARFFNAEILNLGIGSSRFQHAIFDPDLPFTPDMVIAAYGTNNWNGDDSMEDLRIHAADFLRKLRATYPDIPVFAVSPLWRADHEEERPAGNFMACRRVIEEEIRKAGIVLIAGETLIPPYTEYYFDGRVHPNDLGYSLYAEHMLRQMLPHLT